MRIFHIPIVDESGAAFVFNHIAKATLVRLPVEKIESEIAFCEERQRAKCKKEQKHLTKLKRRKILRQFKLSLFNF